MDNEGLITRLRRRAEIRRSIPRGEPDRISDILEEAAEMIESLRDELARLREQEPVAVWNGCILYTDPKPAREIPSELVEWANEYVEIIDDYSLGEADSRYFVKMTFDKMKCSI
jgi:hypothetical protein